MSFVEGNLYGEKGIKFGTLCVLQLETVLPIWRVTNIREKVKVRYILADASFSKASSAILAEKNNIPTHLFNFINANSWWQYWTGQTLIWKVWIM